MAKDIKKRFTVSLDIDTKDAEKQVKATVGNIKTILADMGNASDKMTYFKELVNYLSQIDSAMDNFKKKHGDGLFVKTFGGLDETLKKEFESVFGVAQKQLVSLEQLKNKVQSVKGNAAATGEDLKPLEQEVKGLYEAVGMLDKLDLSGRGKVETRIKKMEAALDGFALAFADVNAKIREGFNFGGTGVPKLSKEMQQEIDKLNKQKKEYQEIIDAINKKPIKVATTIDTDEQELTKLLDEYKTVTKEFHDIERSGSASRDEVNKKLAERVRLATLLVNTRNHITDEYNNDNASDKAYDLANMGDSRRKIDEAENFLNDFHAKSQKITGQIQSIYEKMVNDINGKLANLDVPGDKNISSQYDTLKKKVQEYYDILDQRNKHKLESSEYQALDTQLEEIVKSVQKIKQLDMDDLGDLRDVFGDIEYGEVASVENAMERICNILKIDIPSTTNNQSPLGKMVDEAEYVLSLTGQIKNMFATLSRRTDFEYNVSINGLDIKALKGNEKQITYATQVESYLDNLFSPFVMYGHSHRGGVQSFNISDMLTYLDEYKHALNSFSFVVGGEGIQTLNLGDVDTEHIDKIKQEIDSLNKKSKQGPLLVDQVNQIIEKITGVKNVLRSWDISQIDELAKYMYDVSKNASAAITPMERLQAIFDSVAGPGKVDVSKYEGLLSELNVDNVKQVFNQIAKMENLSLVGENTPLSMGQVNQDIDNVIARYRNLREESNLTYGDIRDEVSKVISHFKNGGGVNSGLDFFKQYFPEGEWQIIKNLLTDAYDGLISIEEVQNRIAAEFSIDPYTFDKIPTGSAQGPETTVDNAKAALQDYINLIDEVKNKSFLSGDSSENVEIGKYTERINAARDALIEFAQAGLLTSEDLQKVQSAYDEASSHLESNVKHYDGYGNGYYFDNYYDEYLEARNEADVLKDESERLKQELEEEKRRQKIDGTSGVSEITGQIERENDTLNEQESIVSRILHLRDELKLSASQTALGITDGKDMWGNESTLDIIKEKQKVLSACLQELIKIGEQEKKNGSLTDDELTRRKELVDQITELNMSVRYKDGSFYNTSSLDVFNSELSDAIEQLNSIVSLRKKIDFGSYYTGTYGTFADTFSGSNIENLLFRGIAEFDDYDQFNSSIVGQLIREYQYLHEEMTKCVIAGKQMPQDILDKMKWFESVDVSQLESAIPRLTELRKQIVALQENVDYHTIIGKDDGYYDNQIQHIQTLIELQKEYISLGGPKETFDYESSLHYSTDELQERLDRYTELRDGARKVEKLKSTFPDVNLRGTSDLANVIFELQEGNIKYEKAVSKVNKLLDEQAAKAKAAAEAESQSAKASAQAQQKKSISHTDTHGISPHDDVGNYNDDINKETRQLENLKAILLEVEQAVQAKTRAFAEEGVAVEQVVNREVMALTELLRALGYIKSAVDIIDGDFVNMASKIGLPSQVGKADSDTTSQSSVHNEYALETTLQSTNGILQNILSAIGNNDAISALVNPLSDAVAELKNVASGIVEHQKTQQTNKSAASVRIANNYGQLSSIADNAIRSMSDGNDDSVKIKGMKALAADIVRVEGAVRDANGSWNGFIIDINEANKATITATNTQSAFAKELNETAETAKKASNETKKSNQPNDFTKSLSSQKSAFEGYRNSLKDVDYLTGELNDNLDELAIRLKTISDADDLVNWKDDFNNLRKQVGIAKSTFNETNNGYINSAKKNLKNRFNKLTDEQKLGVQVYYEQAIADLDKYKTAVQNGKKVELEAITSVTSTLRQKLDAYQKINEEATKTKQVETKNQKFGSTTEINAMAKFKSLKSQASSGEFVNSSVTQNALRQYEVAYNRLIAKRQELANSNSEITKNQEAEFKQLTDECNNAAKALSKIITDTQKLNAKFVNPEPYILGDDFVDNEAGRKAALADFVQQRYEMSVAAEDFKNNYNEVVFAVKNGDGTFTNMTATFNTARTQIGALAGDVKKTTGVFESFFSELKGKFKSIGAYLMASFSFHEVIQVVRQGVQYVREIDSALTELKKVTNETDAAYDQFLQDMSKTGSVVGSTVSELTSSAAD